MIFCSLIITGSKRLVLSARIEDKFVNIAFNAKNKLVLPPSDARVTRTGIG